MNLAEQFISREEVLALVGVPASTLSYLVKTGRFPQPITLRRRHRLWERAQVQEWIAERLAERDAVAAARRGTA